VAFVSKQSSSGHGRKKPHSHPQPVQEPPPGNAQPVATKGPQFAEPIPTPDPTQFSVRHGSDDAAYKILDSMEGTLKPRPFPVVSGVTEPRLMLFDTLGAKGQQIQSEIEKAGQIVFHSVGDTGNTAGPSSQDLVADKMVSDFFEVKPETVPSFLFHLGDVIYSFGESEYYYDQFYDPYRNYPAPIFAIAGNHDGMVAPNSTRPTLSAFLGNFCTAGQSPHRTPESGGLIRTAQIQPGVYYTFEAPFVRILALYSNCLEDPGVISQQDGEFAYLGTTQVDFLVAALERVKSEKFTGAVLIAAHHPPYVAAVADAAINFGKHGGSLRMLQDIDSACAKAGFWPHAVLAGHAHNYQRFTRYWDDRETPFIVCGNGGHGIARLSRQQGTGATIRTPAIQSVLSNGKDKVVLENYDDQDYGYLRIIVDPAQLRIEYHPASDTGAAKTPDDFTTVDLKTRKLVHYQLPS
jgi:hypothetical protein